MWPCLPWPGLTQVQPSCPRLLHRRAAPGTHLRAGWHPHLHHSLLFLDTDLDQAKQVFALIVFSCIFGEGYSNTHDSQQQYCVFNRNEDACRYGSAIGVLAFLASAFFFVVDIYFPQISNATDRKYLVIGDLLFSALWTFLWFVGFCFLTNQWAATKVNDVVIGADSARAAITFSFFSIFSWACLRTPTSSRPSPRTPRAPRATSRPLCTELQPGRFGEGGECLGGLPSSPAPTPGLGS
uniref:MARVEL domain-containing protein n=1 Tax=Capra hircus TaxID=9925 RepID=A0A8C2SGU8_CAPHI